MDRQAGGSKRGNVCEPTADAWRTRQAFATTTQRKSGKEFRTRLRDRRSAADLVAWPRNGEQAIPAPGGRAQSRPDDAKVIRNRHGEESARPRRPFFGCLFCHQSAFRSRMDAPRSIGRRWSAPPTSNGPNAFAMIDTEKTTISTGCWGNKGGL